MSIELAMQDASWCKPAGNQRDFRGLLSQTKDKKPSIFDGWFFIAIY